MTRNISLKFAVSALALGGTMVACKPAADAMRPASASANPAKSGRQAADAFGRAQSEYGKGHLDVALGFAERAVEASPRDIAYRMLLADLYLKSGRFQSAATTYGDIVSLDPGNRRASLSIALCDIAQGHDDAAVAMLDSIAQDAPPADVGLAYAMAGQPRRAIELLEPAARGQGASGRIRQNLAFAYAMAGDWEKARVTAAQDVSPSDLGARLAQWAALAHPGSGAGQVTALLGVRPGADAGQPERLALVSPAAPTALAAADPAPAAPAAEAAPAPAPVQQAAAEPVAPPVPPVAIASAAPEVPSLAATVRDSQDPKPAGVTQPLYAGAVAALVTPQPAVLRAGRAFRTRPAGFELPHAAPAHNSGAGIGRYAVQLGAFSTPKAVERAWSLILNRFGFSALTPLSTTIAVPGKGTLHRLSVAGFESRAEADRTCGSIRAKGGACFVRAIAGDAPAQWAARYASR